MCLATEISVRFGNLLVSPDIKDQQGTQNLACVQTITIIILALQHQCLFTHGKVGKLEQHKLARGLQEL